MIGTVAVACPRGLIWYIVPNPDAAAFWEVVLFDPNGNRRLGIFDNAEAALAVYRRDVEARS